MRQVSAGHLRLDWSPYCPKFPLLTLSIPTSDSIFVAGRDCRPFKRASQCGWHISHTSRGMTNPQGSSQRVGFFNLAPFFDLPRLQILSQKIIFFLTEFLGIFAVSISGPVGHSSSQGPVQGCRGLFPASFPVLSWTRMALISTMLGDGYVWLRFCYHEIKEQPNSTESKNGIHGNQDVTKNQEPIKTESGNNHRLKNNTLKNLLGTVPTNLRLCSRALGTSCL